METAWSASAGELRQAGLDMQIAEEFIAHRQKINPEQEWEKLRQENINVLTIKSIGYPKLLKEIYDAPPLLYYRGELRKNINFSLSVVGSRKYSAYGQRAAEKLSAELSQAGIAIVSGLALGIDTLAHLSCLKAGGYTISVLGSGLDRQNIYPSSNRYLADKIIKENGLILSEFPCGTPPLRHHFPRRNRIISGLTLGTLVIEAGEKSGALITARYALEQNREVFAVPGGIFSPNSEGTNNLIKSGARAVCSAGDILESLSLDAANIKTAVASQKIIPESSEEKIILENLTREPTHINQLNRTTQLDTNVINATLLTMELKGYIKNLGGGNYVLS